MTSTNVTQTVNALFAAAGVKTAEVPGGASDNGFSQIMNRTTMAVDGKGSQDAGKSNAAVVQTPVKVEKNNICRADAKNGTDKASAKKNADDLSTETGDAQDTACEDAQEILAEAVLKARVIVEDALNMTPEELDQLLEELGLTQVDLLNTDNLQMLVMAAAGETDQMNILTNEALYGQLQNLTDAVGEILTDAQNQLSELDMTLEDVVSQMQALPEPEQLLSDEVQMQTPVIVENAAGAEEAVPVKEMEPEETKAETDPVQKTQTEAADTENQEISEDRTQTESAGAERKGGEEKHNSNSQFLQQGFDRNTLTAWQNEVTAPRGSETPYSAAQTQDIMNQITEYIKVEAKADMTNLELQLQPETLGTLRIHLTAKEGVVTAQFTAETEAVKAVLEAQTVQLKENLNEQGVKVEAVEVTVASHEFDRSFAENDNSGAEQQEPKKKAARRIQLTEDDMLDEMELSEEDRIAAEIMRQNGNTVDYTA